MTDIVAHKRRITAWAGLAAMAVHLACFALAAAMPVAMAVAEAEAAAHEIVICTASGPVTVDARTLGTEDPVSGGPISSGHAQPDQLRTACDLSLHAANAVALDAAPALSPEPARHAEPASEHPRHAAPYRPAPADPASRPRAPPLSS